MTVEGIITLKINGKTVRRQRMRSFIRNFIDAMANAHGAAGTILDITNAPGSGAWSPLNPGFGGYLSTYAAVYPTAGVDSVGIVVGTGSTAVTLNDYKLDTQVATGNGSGQLAYQAQGVGVTTVAGQVSKTRFFRQFINGSGGSIIVSEVGMQGLVTGGYYLMLRDVVGSPVTVINGDTLNVYIDLKVTA